MNNADRLIISAAFEQLRTPITKLKEIMDHPENYDSLPIRTIALLAQLQHCQTPSNELFKVLMKYCKDKECI